MNTVPDGDDGPPSLSRTFASGDLLLVAMGYSDGEGVGEWFESPVGPQYLFQPGVRWEELHNPAAGTDTWDFVALRGSLQLWPGDEQCSSITGEGAA